MYILKNIWRNKMRNILIGIIIVVIASACAVTLAIRSSADKIIKAYEEKYPVEATIGMDRETLMNSLKENDSQEDMIDAFNNIESITIDEVEKYGDSDYVSSYYYTYSLSMNGKDIKEATDSLVKETTTTETETTTKTDTETKKNSSSSSNSNRPGRPPEDGGTTTTRKSSTTRKKTTTTIENIRNEKANKGTFSIVGYNSYEAMSDFISGNYTITSGEVSNDFDSNSCVISEELATLNEIKVGDTITLVSPYDTSVTYDLVVTGIYKENSSSASDTKNMYSNSANTIITNVTTVKNILEKDTKNSGTVNPTYILKDTSIIEKFSEEVKEKGLSEYYTVTDNYETVQSATDSIISVKGFATTFLIITLVIGGVVLLAINMINIRERKYEIGVLRTIGLTKIKLTLQFMCELLIVTVFGLLIGAGIGSFASVKVSNELLKNEIENSESNYEEINKNFGGSMEGHGPKENRNGFGITNIEKVTSMDAVVDFKVLLELIAIGVGLTIFSSISSIIAIARFSPLTILKERS